MVSRSSLIAPIIAITMTKKICQAAVVMLAKIGVKVNLDAIPKAQHFPKIQNRVSDFYMLGWGVSHPG